MMKNNHCWTLPAHIAGMPTLTANEKLLYAYLLSNPDGAASPKTQTMAEACGVDKTTTLLAVKGLERAKLVKVKRTSARKLKRMVDITVLSDKALPTRRTRKTK